MNNQQKAGQLLLNGLDLGVALAPTLLAALAILWFFSSWFQNLWLYLLALLFIPLLVGLGAAAAVLRWQAPCWAAYLLALAVVSAPYILLILIGQMSAANCVRNAGAAAVSCGEFNLYFYCVVGVMNLANAVSVVMLISILRSKVPEAPGRAARP